MPVAARQMPASAGVLFLFRCNEWKIASAMQNGPATAITKNQPFHVYFSMASVVRALADAASRCFAVPSISQSMLRKNASDNGIMRIVVSVNPAMFCLKK